MKNWVLRSVYFLLALFGAGSIVAYADYSATQGSGSTVAAFVCQSTKICPGAVIMDSTGQNAVAVKAASTAAAAGDISFVTNESPNSQLSAAVGAAGTAAGCASGSSNTLVQCFYQFHTDLTAALPAGGNTIGKVDVLGNAGAVIDFAGQNAAAPANAFQLGCQFNTSPTTISSGNASPCQLDNAGNLLVNLKTAIPAGGNTIGNVNPGTAANWGIVATGAAPPANAVYLGANASGATGGHVAALISCDSHVFKHITSATDTLAVQGVASQTIRICGWRSRAAGTATWFLENTASANANCASANTQITGVATEAANTGETMLAPFWTGLANTSGNGLCINSTGTGGVDVDIWYTQF